MNDNESLPLYRETTIRVLKKEVEPFYESWEAAGQVPRELWNALGHAGLLGVDMPECYGAAGASFDVSQMVLREVSRMGFGGLASGLNIHANIVMPYLLAYGSDDQKTQWLPKMIAGEAVGAIAMTEPGAGSDLAALRTRATREAEGWRINGSKIFITNGLHADLVIVCAKTDLNAGAKGVSLFLVDASLAGFSRGPGIKKIGQHASDTTELFFDDLLVPHDALLGEENRGFAYLMQELPRERLGVAAQALGAAEGAMALTIDYVQQRKAFGKPVAEFQNTRFKLAEMQADIALNDAYCKQCMQAYLAGEMTTQQASILKLTATQMQCRVVDECLQLFGGYGYTQEYPISRFYLDARVQTIYAGTSEIMKEVIARGLFSSQA